MGDKKGTCATWLVDAVAANARILANCEATRVVWTKNRGGYCEHPKRAVGVLCRAGGQGEGEGILVEAHATVVACGALMTPGLLRASGLKNPNIGKNLHLHPVRMAWGYFPPGVEPEGNCYQGGIITAMCKEGAKWDGTGYGTVIQTPALPPGSFGAIMPWVSGADMKQWMMKYPRTAHIFALTRDLKIATNNFSPAALLGRGGFETVYKRVLPKGKNTVAVKHVTKDSSRGKEEFISEISVINRLHHKNLVPQLGWCHKNGQLIMVYEFMPNGSVDKHIFNDDVAGGFLNWERRYNIVSGVASALLYLHEECEQQVIHRDVKASNMMLDSKYKARLGSFGLARLIELDPRSFTTTAVAGTLGYIALECFHTGRADAESNVFSFGALTLEVSCGRPPKSSTPEQPDLVGQVWKLYRENKLLEAADSGPTTLGTGSINEEDIKPLLVLGLACSHPNPEVRPSMREVTQTLARTMPPPLVPFFRPLFVWSHYNSLGSSFTTSSLTSSGSVPNTSRSTCISLENSFMMGSSIFSTVLVPSRLLTSSPRLSLSRSFDFCEIVSG